MANLSDYSTQDQQRMRDWMKLQGGAADMGMAASALGVKPISTPTNTPKASTPTQNNTAQSTNSLVTQKGTTQYVTPFTNREQQGFDTWYNMLAGGSVLPADMEKSIRRPYEKAGQNAYNSAIGNMTEFTGGRLNSWAAKAAADAKQDYALQGADAVNNANLKYAEMLLGGLKDYTGAVSGRDDVAYGRDFTERQQDLTNNLAIGEATGYLPASAMNTNNPWIVNGKPVENVDFQSMINARKALNPNDPDIPLLNQARNLKIQQNPEQYGQYAGTMTSGAYETLSGRKTTADVVYNNAKLELDRAEQAYAQDPNNPENQARLMNARASLSSASAALSNAATNRAQLDWEKNPNNPNNILKISQANQGANNDSLARMTAWIYSEPSNEAALNKLRQNKSSVLQQLMEAGYDTNEALQYYAGMESDLSGGGTDYSKEQ